VFPERANRYGGAAIQASKVSQSLAGMLTIRPVERVAFGGFQRLLRKSESMPSPATMSGKTFVC
jgi:hypothetical protein